jgi:hypothetical protein
MELFNLCPDFLTIPANIVICDRPTGPMFFVRGERWFCH